MNPIILERMDKNNKKILVVEDEQQIAQVLSEVLIRNGFEVTIAKDGTEGCEMALKIKPDLILLDIMLPSIDGLSMLAELRKDEWGAKVLVIALTNYGDTERVNRAISLGVDEYLIKSDWNLEDVIRQVKKKLGIS